VRRLWPEVLERLRELRRTPWTFIKDNAEPLDVTDDVLVLGVRSPGLRDTLAARPDYVAYLQQAVNDVLGRTLRIDAVVHPTGAAASAATAGAGTSGRPSARRPSQPSVAQRSGRQASHPPRSGTPLLESTAEGSTEQPTGPTARHGGQSGQSDQPVQSGHSDLSNPSDQIDPDDAVLDEVSGADLLTRELGASIVEVVDET
jgi:DNA polymerase-3 subunit gamma/tau